MAQTLAMGVTLDKSQQIIKRIMAQGSLPSLSAIALRLIQMASDDAASTAELAALISQDPGLTTRLLRMVNSPAFRRLDREITGIGKALSFLGLREVRIMALSLSLRDTLPVKKGGQDYYLFWRSSMHRAVLAREVARRLALNEVEEAFVAGLVQEMGLPLLLRSLTAEEAQGFPGMGASLKRQLKWERQALGLDHRQVGSMVLGHWGLPAVLVECQQILSEGDRDKVPLLVEVCDFAHRGTEAFFMPEIHLTDIYQVAWRYFGFDDETVNYLLATTLVYVGEAASALDVELNREADLLEVMEKANNALSRLSSQLAPHLQAALAGEQAPPPTPARRGQEEQEASDRRLKDEAVAQTLDAVAHEIRNPLMSVGGFARRLAKQVGGGGHLQRYAEVIVAEAARLDKVLADINRLLTPYRPALGAMDLAQCLQDLARSLEASEDDSPCEDGLPQLKWHLPPVPVPMRGDPQGLTMALRQIIGYCCHLMHPDHTKGMLHVHLQANPQEAVISLLGQGQPPDQGQDALAERSFGPALALAQARRVMEAHGGGLVAAPAAGGKGFLLTVRLPQAQG
ncbi:MAG: HDOD domain-containing protein [Desulfarculus sp.]|nr:HDOD domain-containing protein [Desulfarculus sp.]